MDLTYVTAETKQGTQQAKINLHHDLLGLGGKAEVSHLEQNKDYFRHFFVLLIIEDFFKT
jgi:hypothetical protein